MSNIAGPLFFKEIERLLNKGKCVFNIGEL